LISITVIARDQFEFKNSCQLFFGTDDESLCVVAVRVCREMRSRARSDTTNMQQNINEVSDSLAALNEELPPLLDKSLDVKER
jgi:hypothetical protein